MNVLHELPVMNLGNKVIFPLVGIGEFTKLCPYEPVKFKYSTKIGPHKIYDSAIVFEMLAWKTWYSLESVCLTYKVHIQKL